MTNLFTKLPFSAEQYKIDRENVINDELSQPYINTLKARFDNASEADKLKMLGIKGRKNAEILTPQQDKAKSARKHDEITLQAEFCTWVRHNYPEVKFLRHEREKQRSKFMGNQMKVMNSAGAMPDWECTTVTDKYTGLLVEFKKPGEKWLMADGETIKEQYAYQYHCHVGLWKQRRVVYFCNDLEIAKLILQQYLQGRTMRQRVYKYPEKFAYLEGIL